MAQKKENRGGSRKGAGRKPGPKKEFSERFKKGVMAALKKKEKETGRSIFDLFADRMYKTYLQDAVFSSMFKIAAEVMVEKVTNVTNNDNRIQSVVMLPPVQPAPELPAGTVIDAEIQEDKP